MSETLSPETPETNAATPSVEVTAPADVTAVEVGSVEDANTKVVDASRFNGLMAAHQRTLNEMEAMKSQLAALEARNNEEIHEVADDDVREEIAALRTELMSERLELAKQRALDKYPGAKPLADLIVGSSVAEIETVARAVAERLDSLVTPSTPETSAPVTEPTTEAAATTAAAEAPVVAGGAAAPTTPSTADAVKAALEAGSWADYWQAKAGATATATLG